ncbi:MAG: hypothetical protein KTR31_03490 [Myxococcales bacterium]|nr:hypothetical protein [Myxococcales bacterium]
MDSSSDPRKRRQIPNGQDPVDTQVETIAPSHEAADDESSWFDYTSFEGELDNLVAREASRTGEWEAPRAGAPVRRPTIDLRSMPQDDAMYDVRELGPFTVLTVRGRINESFPGKEIADSLQGRVLFDLTEVTHVTSFGVRTWLDMLRNAKISQGYIIRASPAVVHQVSMIQSFRGPAQIVSVLAPYVCLGCGAEFGVTYHSIDDHQALASRNPHLVTCPDCRIPVAMDENPWVFFGLDEELATSLEEDVTWAVAHLTESKRHAPIEKTVVGETTQIRFRGPITEFTALRRAFTGLEGEVVVDLRSASEISAGGMSLLVGRLEQLHPSVARVLIDGAPIELVSTLLEHGRPGRVWIRSVVTKVSNRTGLERHLVLDLEQARGALSSGGPLPVEVPWDPAESQVEHLAILKKAVRKLVYRSDALLGPDGRFRDLVPSGASAWLGVGLAVLGVGALANGVAMLVDDGPSEPTPTTEVSDGMWSHGSALPPGWVEVPVLEEGNQMFLVGHGIGDSIDDAEHHARLHAAGLLLEVVSNQLAETTGFTDRPPPRGTEGWKQSVERFEQLTSNDLPMMRQEEVTRRTGSRTEMVARYAVPRAHLDARVEAASRTERHMGITVAARPPWSVPGVSVVKVASYITSAQPGDVVDEVGGRIVSDLDSFRRLAEQSSEETEPGDILTMNLDRQGEKVQASVKKPKPVQEATEPTAPADEPTSEEPTPPAPTPEGSPE